MNLDNLSHTSGEWLRGTGPESDIVISSRIRLARNLAAFPFTNRATPHQKADLESLLRERIAKLERAPRLNYLSLANLSTLEHLVVQARFVRGDADNSTDAEVRAWLKRLGELKPREVHIQNSEPKAGGPRATKKLKPIAKSRVAEIAAEVTKKIGIPAAVYAGEGVFD